MDANENVRSMGVAGTASAARSENSSKQTPIEGGAPAFEWMARRRALVQQGDGEAVEYFDDQLERLPSDDPELAVAVYQMYAISEDADEREAIAVRIDLLLTVNRPEAKRLWHLVLADPDRYVSAAAQESILIATDEGKLTQAEADDLTAVATP